MNAIEEACEILGSQRALASELGVTPATVNQWIGGVRPVPEDRCLSIENLTGAKVVVERIRADVQWVRIVDKSWPHPKGRPLVDHAVKSMPTKAAA